MNATRIRQWFKPGQAAKTTPKAGLHPKKRMLSVLWGVQEVLYWELVPENTTITGGTMYRAQLNKLAAEIKSKGLQRGKIYMLQR